MCFWLDLRGDASLQHNGYDVQDLPSSAEQLMLKSSTMLKPVHQSRTKHCLSDVSAEYEQLTPYSQRLRKIGATSPGHLNSDKSANLRQTVRQCFIGVQPTFGYEGDPMRLLFSRSASPHHGFAAYYTYLEQIWQADAVLHLAPTALEFMPGKQIGMSGECYPDNLIGTIPNLTTTRRITLVRQRSPSVAATLKLSRINPLLRMLLYKGLKELSLS